MNDYMWAIIPAAKANSSEWRSEGHLIRAANIPADDNIVNCIMRLPAETPPGGYEVALIEVEGRETYEGGVTPGGDIIIGLGVVFSRWRVTWHTPAEGLFGAVARKAAAIVTDKWCAPDVVARFLVFGEGRGDAGRSSANERHQLKAWMGGGARFAAASAAGAAAAAASPYGDTARSCNAAMNQALTAWLHGRVEPGYGGDSAAIEPYYAEINACANEWLAQARLNK